MTRCHVFHGLCHVCMPAVFRHVNGNMQDDVIYAADLVMQISGLHESHYATWVSAGQLDAQCWSCPVSHLCALCSVSGTCLLVACSCSDASVPLSALVRVWHGALASSALPCCLTPCGAHGRVALGYKARRFRRLLAARFPDGLRLGGARPVFLSSCLKTRAANTERDRTGLAGCMRNVHAYFPRGLPSGQAGRELVPRLSPHTPHTSSRLSPQSAAAAQACTLDAEANIQQQHDAPPAAPACPASGRWPRDLNALNLQVGL